MLGGVSRYMEDFDLNLAHPEACAIPKRHGSDRRGIIVLPVMASSGRQIQAGLCSMHQLAGSGNEIGMDVGFRHVGDPETVELCRLQVRSHVTLWIDYQRLTADGAADEIAGLRELGVIKPLQEHCHS